MKKPTILTGANDGGKSAALAALGFLLTGKPLLTDGDRTNLLRGEMTESLDEPDSAIHKVTESVVVGRFTLSSEEQAEHQLPSEVQIRRVSNSGEAVRLELLRVVPRDVDLRGLDAAKLDELKRRVKAREIDPAGKKSARDTWLAPLRERN